MSYRLEYLAAVVRDDIPALSRPVQQQIRKAIERKLTTTPELFGKPLRFNHSGLRSLRVGDYRVIYTIEPTKHLVIITAIGHRKDIYERG